MGRARWGPGQPRSITAESNRAKPLTWNRQAAAARVPRFVFASSLSDVWDHEVPEEWRDGLRDLISATPWLQWLLLTKRTDQLARIWPRWLDTLGRVPANVWLGATVEDQERADERIPVLADQPAAGRFLSVEPLIGPVRLNLNTQYDFGKDPTCKRIGWVIVGGESRQGDAHDPRPMHPAWARAVRDECAEAVEPVALWFKQHGSWRPTGDPCSTFRRAADAGRLLDMVDQDGERSWHAIPTDVRQDGPGPVERMREQKVKAPGYDLLDGVRHHNRPPATAGTARVFVAGTELEVPRLALGRGAARSALQVPDGCAAARSNGEDAGIPLAFPDRHAFQDGDRFILVPAGVL